MLFPKYNFTAEHKTPDDVGYAFLEKDYEEAKLLLVELDQHHASLVGTEGIISEAVHKTADVAGALIKRISRIATRLLILLRSTGEQIFSTYTAILERWDKRLKNNIGRIDNTKFGSYKLSIPDYEVMKKRIAVLNKLHFLIDNLEHVCDSPAQRDTNDWRVPEFMAAYRAMQEIGFDSTSYDLIRKLSPGYKKQKYKATLDAHGYMVAHLQELVKDCSIVAKYASKSTRDIIHTKVTHYSDQLLKYEQAVRTNEDMDESSKNEKLQQIDMKIARLWWITHFINSLYKVSSDVVNDVLNLCKVAEKAMH